MATPPWPARDEGSGTGATRAAREAADLEFQGPPQSLSPALTRATTSRAATAAHQAQLVAVRRARSRALRSRQVGGLGGEPICMAGAILVP